MQPARELSLQKAVCLVPGWPRPAEGTFLGPSCLQRCWPWAGSCLLLPAAVPYGQALLRRQCPQRPACPRDVMLGSGAERRPGAEPPLSPVFLTEAGKEGNCRKFPRTVCPTCLAVGKGEIPGAMRLGTGCPRGRGGRLLPIGIRSSAGPWGLLEPPPA